MQIDLWAIIQKMRACNSFFLLPPYTDVNKWEKLFLYFLICKKYSFVLFEHICIFVHLR